MSSFQTNISIVEYKDWKLAPRFKNRELAINKSKIEAFLIRN